jgi:hypothetical protein
LLDAAQIERCKFWTLGGRRSEKDGGVLNAPFEKDDMMKEETKRRFLSDFESDLGLAKEAEPLRDLVWEYRDVFGDHIMELKEGIISYEVELGCNVDDLAPPKFMNQGPVKKAVLRCYLQLYEEAGVVEKTFGEAYSNAFLVKKTGHISKGQEKMDDITFAKQ